MHSQDDKQTNRDQALGTSASRGDSDPSALRHRTEVPSKEYVRSLLRAATKEEWLAIALPVAAGVRVVDECRFHWSNFDIQRSMLQIAFPKSSRRYEIPLARPLCEALKNRRADSRFGEDTDFVFSNRQGKQLGGTHFHRKYLGAAHRRMTRDWPPGRETPSLPKSRSLGHFAIRTWIEAGLPIMAVKIFAGMRLSWPEQRGQLEFGRFDPERYRAQLDAIAAEVLCDVAGNIRPAC
jgi:integrase